MNIAVTYSLPMLNLKYILNFQALSLDIPPAITYEATIVLF
jgi:hypothetical protein